MTSPFQWIIDSAVDMTMECPAKVSQTESRNSTIRSVSRGGRVWRFDITPSPGEKWSETRGLRQQLAKASTYTADTIDFSKTGFDYIVGYQGNVVGTQTMTFTQGSDTVQVTGGTITSGFRFRGGDFIQPLGSNRVYSVVNDVPYNSTIVLLNRPILDASGTAQCVIGKDCKWYVICVAMPTPRVVNYDRVEWSSNFSFVESLA